MSVSQQISAFLPFLRRYARALTGNQSSGDAYVAATIQAMIEDPSLAKLGANPKVSLNRISCFKQDSRFESSFAKATPGL